MLGFPNKVVDGEDALLLVSPSDWAGETNLISALSNAASRSIAIGTTKIRHA
jgi:hypothetical protein